MTEYVWMVWKNARLVGYITAYGEWDALRIAKNKYGENIFIERDSKIVQANPSDSTELA